MGTNGESLLRVSQDCVTVHGMDVQPFKTARRYFISRMCSYVGRSVGPTTSSTSVLRRSNTSGWIERRNITNVSVDAVCKSSLVPWSRVRRRRRTVSRPARRTLKISSRKTFLSEAFQLDGPRYNSSVLNRWFLPRGSPAVSFPRCLPVRLWCAQHAWPSPVPGSGSGIR